MASQAPKANHFISASSFRAVNDGHYQPGEHQRNHAIILAGIGWPIVAGEILSNVSPRTKG